MESKSKLKRDLSSKDIRIKRKAVRQLFEIGEVWILELFKTLLSDNDIWFQSKALNAKSVVVNKMFVMSIHA